MGRGRPEGRQHGGVFPGQRSFRDSVATEESG